MSRPARTRLLARLLTPNRIFVLSFAAVIAVGAVLLASPFSASSGRLRFVDALFSSASAVCVTGLVVIDIGKDLSTLGQVITIVLFQIGGLGIITFSTVFFVLMGRGLSFKGREIIQSTFLHTPRRDFLVVARAVLVYTLVIEALGTLILTLRFWNEYPLKRALYHAVYNAISAFNNCGYSLFSDNLMGYRADPTVNLTIMSLIVLGGIGFIVHYEILGKLRGRQRRISVHSKMAILTTAILILAGALLFFLFEREYILKDLPWGTKLLVSFFHSVSPRTAGFNTVDIGLLTNATILLLLVLMFVGASPGSTGGGVKTTSAALLVLMIWHRLRGNPDVTVFNRTVPREIIGRTISIIFASAFSVAVIASVLLIAGGNDPSPVESRGYFVEYVFDTVSAYGTVGLSMGITPKLNDVQKVALVLMMFAGRVGPLTLALSLAQTARRGALSYAEESVMVG